MNCLTVVLWLWVKSGFRGSIGVLCMGDPFPHFALFQGHTAYHYKPHHNGLPWYQQFWYKGYIAEDYVGEDDQF